MINDFDFTKLSYSTNARIINGAMIRGIVQFENGERIPEQLVGIEIFDSYTEGCAHYGAAVMLHLHREGSVHGQALFLHKEQLATLIVQLESALQNFES